MRKYFLVIVTLLMLALSVSAQSNTPDARYVGEIEAPAFSTEVDWINTENPLTIDGLHGKIIILDFWTYGCINCIHMIPVLRQLEERFPEELVVIGVHSAKFDNEGETENLQQIVQRYGIEHPVINDDDFLVWRTYQATAWPTFVVIDPRGYVIGAQAGEVPFEAFETFLAATIEYYDNNPEFGTIDRTPLEFALEGAGDPGTALAFPGKVLADTVGNRLFISDTNHHRIVVADLTTYEVLDIIGTGQRGYTEGAYDEATFDQPQGMEIVGDTLYIADVNNHAIRAVDLVSQEVFTVAGTGNMARTLVQFDTIINDPLGFDIRSPWDVVLGDNDLLYIAMAGSHQIWQLDIEANVLRASVGNGRESQTSTTLATSELAQPSGLHWQDGLLYFADSESSTIRVANIADNSVSVISGTTNNDLFDYGDIDGEIGVSRLQHALGVTANADGSLVYIADTYNSKIKLFDPVTGVTSSLFGLSGNGGYRDGDASVAQFDEPGGLDFANNLLYVADTNNHVIRIVDLETNIVSTLEFPNPEALVIEREEPTILGGNTSEGLQIQLEPQTVRTGDSVLILNFTLPEDYKINELTDSTVDIVTDDLVQLVNDDTRVVISDENSVIPLNLSAGDSSLSLTIALFYCEDDSYCLIDDVTIVVPLIIEDNADTSQIVVNREVTLPDFLVEGD
ncbi:MAG: hypothetical protein Phog2KO_19430 [Phototrophicaceae bacterium]